MKKIILSILLLSSSCDATGYDNLIRFYAKKHGIREDLAHALVKRESGYNPNAIGKDGEIGLAQVIFSQHKGRLGLKHKRELYNPHRNLDIAFHYLRECINWRGNLRDGLACYNAGRGGAGEGYGYGYADKILEQI